MHVTTVAACGVDLVVREWGDEDDPLLFWPALSPWGSLQLIEAAPLLAERGYRLASIAAPGADESPALADTDGYEPTRLAALALATADALSFDRFGFVGASWGASIGVHLAAAYPERIRALVLLDGGYADSPVDLSLPELERQLAADLERFIFASWDAYFEWARAQTRRWSEGLEARYRAGMTESGGAIVPRADARVAARALHGLSLQPVQDAHRSLNESGVPTLLIVPADDADSAKEIERFRSLVPDAVIEHLDAGHDILQDQPTATAETIAAWLARLEGHNPN